MSARSATVSDISTRRTHAPSPYLRGAVVVLEGETVCIRNSFTPARLLDSIGQSGQLALYVLNSIGAEKGILWSDAVHRDQRQVQPEQSVQYSVQGCLIAHRPGQRSFAVRMVRHHQPVEPRRPAQVEMALDADGVQHNVHVKSPTNGVLSVALMGCDSIPISIL